MSAVLKTMSLLWWQVPLEALRRVTRERKTIIDEMEATIDAISSTAVHGPRQEKAAALQSLLCQLQGLKRKVPPEQLLLAVGGVGLDKRPTMNPN